MNAASKQKHKTNIQSASVERCRKRAYVTSACFGTNQFRRCRRSFDLFDHRHNRNDPIDLGAFKSQKEIRNTHTNKPSPLRCRRQSSTFDSSWRARSKTRALPTSLANARPESSMSNMQPKQKTAPIAQHLGALQQHDAFKGAIRTVAVVQVAALGHRNKNDKHQSQWKCLKQTRLHRADRNDASRCQSKSLA